MDFSSKLSNSDIFFILNFGLLSFIKSKTSLLVYVLFFVSKEQTTEVFLFEIGKNAIGPNFENI